MTGEGGFSWVENSARQWLGIGGKREWSDIAIDAFGNAVGNSIAGSYQKEAGRNQTAALQDERHKTLMAGREGLSSQQLDILSERASQSGFTLEEVLLARGNELRFDLDDPSLDSIPSTLVADISEYQKDWIAASCQFAYTASPCATAEGRAIMMQLAEGHSYTPSELDRIRGLGIALGSLVGARALGPLGPMGPATPAMGVESNTARSAVANTADRAFKLGEDVIHFEKHGSEITQTLGYENYSLGQYVQDANAVIRNGTFALELNAYVSIPGGTGSAKGLMVGVDRTTGEITTMHMKPISWFGAKAPSLGWEAQPKVFRTDTIGPNPQAG